MAGRLICLLLLALPACAPRSGESTLPDDVAQGIPFTLAQRFRVNPADVDVDIAPAVWPDACLGITLEAACAQVQTSGYRVEAEVADRAYEFRSTEADPLNLMLAAAPDPGVGPPVLVLEERAGRCRTMRVSADGRAAIGLCGGPLLGLPLLRERRRPDELSAFAARLAPFTYDADTIQVSFQGQGSQPASPAWRRAVAAWARLIFAETDAGRSGASWGSALAYQRPQEQAGYCRFLSVDAYGFAFASTAWCDGGDVQPLGSGWLTDEELAAFDAWYYRYAPNYREHAGLRFFGQGAEEMPDAEMDALDHWAAALFNRLAGR